ncbi:MAG: hypothetical protein ACERKT_08565, partial [Acidobacteriota bacterium]
MGDGPTGISALRNRPYEVLLGALMLASAALLIHYRSDLNFMLDDWAFVIYREDGGLGDFLDPHNEHISILPVAIFKLFLSVFGMGSAMPLQILSVAAFLLSVFVLFVYLKSLVAEPAALIGCAVILFLGAAWEDLLWAFQIGFSISMAAGIGALVMLRRQDSFGDRIACLLLVISMISTSLGIPFAIGAGVMLLLQRENLIRRLYVTVVPVCVYGLWYLGWGHTAESALSFDNALHAPEYIARSFSLTATEVTGLSKVLSSTEVIPSLLVGLLALVAVAWGVRQREGIPRPLLVAAAIALAFWGLAALNLAPGRGFEASRYQFPNAVFLLMILAGAFEGARPRARLLAVLGLIALAAIVVNIDAMRSGYWNVLKPLSDKGIAGLTAVEIARGTVNPGLAIGMNLDDTAYVTAGDYFEAEEKYGSPAWSESEIEESSGLARSRVDQILVAALPVSGIPLPAGLASGSCEVVRAGSPGSAQNIRLPAQTFTFRPQRQVFLAVGRYADGAATGAAL